jgi:hypothetical protein
MQQAVITGESGTGVHSSTGHESGTLMNIVEMPKENTGANGIGQEKSVRSPELLQGPQREAPAKHRRKATCGKDICASLPRGRHARPRTVAVSRRISGRHLSVEYDIPLYLVPHVIALGIRKRGESVFRISVKRTKQHLYTIRIRTAKNERRRRKKDGASVKSREPDVPGH